MAKSAPKLDEACHEFIRAAIEAKAATAGREAFWQSKCLDRAFRSIFGAVRAVPIDQLPPYTQWQDSVSELLWDHADSILNAESVDAQVASLELANELLGLIENLAAKEWITFFPLERRFHSFPAFSSLGDFAIVNASAGGTQFPESLIERFTEIVSGSLSVNLVKSPEMQSTYPDVADHWQRKSGGVFPGRPLLALKLGRGAASSNRWLLRIEIGRLLPLLSHCGAQYDRMGFGRGLIATHPVMLPDGVSPMPDGLITILPAAIAMNVNTGHAEWWSCSPLGFETSTGETYHPDVFEKIWKETAQPLLLVLRSELALKFHEPLQNALTLLHKSRYADAGRYLSDCVIATETILNPFNQTGEITERFALIVASLSGETAAEKREAHRRAKVLYRLRSHAVHRSRMTDDEKPEEPSARDAFSVFSVCLRKVCTWLLDRVEAGQVCDKEAFDAFVLQLIFP